MQLNKSDSDLSSDTSWTLVHGSESVSRTNSFDNVDVQATNESKTKELLNDDIGATKTDANCAKLDIRTVRKNKKKPHKCNNSKHPAIDYTNLLSIIACLFTIVGITLLTTLVPPNLAASADLDQMQYNLEQVYEHTNNPTAENADGSIQAALEAMETATSLYLRNRIPDDFYNEQPTCETEENYNSTDELSKLKIQVIAPYTEEIFGELSSPSELSTIKEKLQNNTRSLYNTAKALLRNPTLQMFVATLIQDVCLIKLITEFSKRNRDEESEQKIPEQKKVRKLLSLTKKKIIKSKKHPKSKHSKVETENKLPSKSNSLMQPDENGKSECERRFEELDSKWSTLGQNHRQKIQQIKSKFHQEIYQIREQEKESLSRKQKIDFTREKFLQRLKADREVYLHRLRKLRDEKQKVLSEVCRSFKMYRNLSSKDVSVGNFAVVLPNQFSFSQKLEEIKSKERSNLKLQAVNNELISYVPTIAAPVPSSGEHNVQRIATLKDYITTYDTLRKKYEKKRKNLWKKRGSKSQSEKFTSLFQESSNSLVEPEEPQQNFNENDGQEAVNNTKVSKIDLNQLYDAAFEQNSKNIKNQDQMKWSRKIQDFKRRTSDLPNRQIRRQKIFHKGLL